MQKVNWYEGSLQIVSRNMLAHSPELSHWSCFSTRMLFNRQISLNEHENQRDLEKEKNESSPTACREYAKVGESSCPHCLRRWCSGCILKALKSSIPSFILSPTLVNCPNQCLINYIIDTPKILILEKLWQ